MCGLNVTFNKLHLQLIGIGTSFLQILFLMGHYKGFAQL